MCKSEFEIHFCSCEFDKNEDQPIHNQNSRRFKKHFDKDKYLETHLVWKLSKYMGETDLDIVGMIIMPTTQLTADLTEDYLVQQLNTKNLFDFDYTPSEGDYLVVSVTYVHNELKKLPRPDIHEYMAFIFTNGHWKTGIYDVFHEQAAFVKSGKVRIDQSKEEQ